MQGIQNKTWLIKYMGKLSGAGLGLLMAVLVFPATARNVEAAMNAEVSGEVTANIKSTLAISLSDTLNFDIAPLAGGNFAADETQVHIATNNVSGYKVYVTASNEGKLVSADKSQTEAINPVNGVMTAVNYKDNLNTWGYSTQAGEAAEYRALPLVAETPVFESEQQASDDTYELGFAVAVDTELPSGTYQGAVVVSAVANPKEVTNLSELTYMQDMTTEICQNTMDYVDVNNYITKQLIDTRDGKSYWVAKLADGNCWMTQNLALDLNRSKPLTSNDSDTSTSWTPTENTQALASTGVANRSWDLGKFVMKHPANGTPCSSGQTTPCAAEFQNVSTGWEPTYVATTETDEDGKLIVNPVNVDNNTYDAHYLLGNHYTWGAATAGANNATRSICPKNWRLPVAGVVGDATTSTQPTGDFLNLVVSYGYPKDNYTPNRVGPSTPTVQVAMKGMATEPMYIVPGGYVARSAVGLEAAPAVGYYWSSTAVNSSSAFVLDFSKSAVMPSHPDHVLEGFSVRCIAR